MRKQLTILLLLIVGSISSQTINRVDYIQGPTINAPNRWTGKILENDGKYYINRGGMSGDFIVNDSLIRDIHFGNDVLDQPTSHTVIPIYEVDKGVTGHVPLEFVSGVGFYPKDSLFSIVGSGRYLLIGEDTIYGDLINGEDKAYGFYLLTDQDMKIKMLEKIPSTRDHKTLITDDAIYVAYNWFTNIFNEESIFMGENFDDGDQWPDVILHKIDRATLTKEWSRRIATNGNRDVIDHFTLDNEGNLVMILEGVGSLYFGDSLVSEGYFPEDYFDEYTAESYIVKINTNGEFLDFMVYYGTGAQIVTDIVFSEHNEMLIMGSLGTLERAYLGNQIIEIEDNNIPGYLMKYNSDWNLDWYRIYDGYNGYVTSAIFDGDEIVVSYQSIISISDDDEVFDDPSNQGSFHLHRLDKNGKEISGTVSAGRESAIIDLKKIGEDRFLVLVLDTPFNGFSDFSFLDYETQGIFEGERLFIFDISGDLLESVTAISEILEHNRIIAYPNPLSSEQILNILLPTTAIASEYNVSINSIGGAVEKVQRIKLSNHSLSVSLENIRPGVKIVSIQSSNEMYTTQIILN